MKELVSPVGLELPPAGRAAAPPLPSSAASVVVLSNAKHNADVFFLRLAGGLRQRGLAVSNERKRNAGMGAGHLIRELSARAHAIVTGMGD
jgi:hypothetical protein